MTWLPSKVCVPALFHLSELLGRCGFGEHMPRRGDIRPCGQRRSCRAAAVGTWWVLPDGRRIHSSSIKARVLIGLMPDTVLCAIHRIFC